MSVKALVVDDQAIVRGNLRLRLERLGCTVTEAADAREGLAMFRTHGPHLVTLDLIMPTVEGYTALDFLRDIRKTGTPTDVVIISSKTQDREEFLAEGAIEFLAKPFENFGGLVRKLEPLIRSISAEIDA
jgi:CheY-like chemotaxis protein